MFKTTHPADEMNHVTGSYSIAIGRRNHIFGKNSFAMGTDLVVEEDNIVVFGNADDRITFTEGGRHVVGDEVAAMRAAGAALRQLNDPE